jgi:uroporphyrin-3 C-methyltransferase
MTAEANTTPTPEPAAPQPRNNSRSASVAVLAIAIAAVAVALAWNWHDTRRQFDTLRVEMAQQLRESRDEAHAARVIAGDVQEGLRQAQSSIGAIEVKLLNSQSQQEALDSLYQELSRSRDDWMLAEAEQTLNIAAQQLQLAGNVRAALTALQSVDARLAQSDGARFLAIRKVLARDIEKLKAAPGVDVAGMTLRLDQILEQVDEMPLAIEAHAPTTPREEVAPQSVWWKQTLGAAWGEIKQLVRVERLDSRDPTLLAPEQRYFLRQNVKLRLLHARLALLQRDEQAFRNDLQACIDWLQHYFDVQEGTAAHALTALRELQQAAVDVELPNIGDSLNAVRGAKLAQERTS